MQGTFKVVIAGITVRTLGEGSHFGEVALLTQGPRTASVISTGDSNLAMMLPYEKFKLLAE